MKFPISNKFELELTSKCTLLCPNCPRTFQEHKKDLWDNGNINEDKLIEFLKDSGANDFRLTGAYGDALYHPHLIKTLRAIKAMGGRFIFNTNGSYRQADDWQAIADLMGGTDLIEYSIDGTPDNFTEYRINGDWKSIEIGARILSNAGCNMRWKYIVFKYNQDFESMRIAFDTAKELGFKQFVIIHTHRAREDQLANKADFDENLTKLEEYVYHLNIHHPKLKIGVTPRSSTMKIKEIIQNETVQEKFTSSKQKGQDATIVDIKQSKVTTKNINKKRSFQNAPIVKKETYQTEHIFPQCMNIENYTNFVSSEGLFLPCCFMRVDQQQHFDEAGITKEDEKSLSIYNNTLNNIVKGAAFKKIMSNFDNMQVCHRQCSISRTKT
jgi:MoaA/NifB/PqqE/SkfB family radical SAM enzyme